MIRQLIPVLFTAAASVGLLGQAHAAGIYEVNEACRADGCLPGDDAGGRIVIDTASIAGGTVRLTSNLRGGSAIVVSGLATDAAVTIDLNGYELHCDAASPCAGNLIGVDVFGTAHVTVRNGQIRGFGRGVRQGVAGSLMVVENVQFTDNTTAVEATAGVIRNSVFEGGTIGITNPSRVQDADGSGLRIVDNYFMRPAGGTLSPTLELDNLDACAGNHVAWTGASIGSFGGCLMIGEPNQCGVQLCAPVE